MQKKAGRQENYSKNLSRNIVEKHKNKFHKIKKISKGRYLIHLNNFIISSFEKIYAGIFNLYNRNYYWRCSHSHCRLSLVGLVKEQLAV